MKNLKTNHPSKPKKLSKNIFSRRQFLMAVIAIVTLLGGINLLITRAANEGIIFNIPSPPMDSLSGIAVKNGIYYVNNDHGGNKIQTYNSSGELLATYSITGASNSDWEDITIGKDASGNNQLFIGDIGTHTRTTHVVYQVPLPVPDTTKRNQILSTPTAKKYTYSYNDGNWDAESLAYNNTNHKLYVITKHCEEISCTVSAGLYEFPTTLADGSTITISRIGSLKQPGVANVTDMKSIYRKPTSANFNSDGTRLLVTGYVDALVYIFNPSIPSEMFNGTKSPAVIAGANGMCQREGGTFTEDSSQVLFVTEISQCGSNATSSPVYARNNPTPPTAVTLPVDGYVLTKTEDFNAINSVDWKVYDKTIYTRSQAIYMKENAYIDNGSLVIRTRRHCVDPSVDILKSGNSTLTAINDSTATSAACPIDKKTAYSSAYLTSLFTQKEGKIEIKAKAPTMQNGYWLGLWMRNQSGWDADPVNYGELDVSEIYGDNPNQNTATSRFSVVDGKTKMVQHANDNGGPISASWHTFAMEWDNAKISYYYDGKFVPTTNGNADGDINYDTQKDVSARGVSEQQFLDIMNQSWETRLEVQVKNAGDTWHPAPNNSSSFNEMLTYIDYIKYYEKSTTSPPSDIKLSTPTNLTATPSDGKVTLNWSAVPNANNYTVRWGQNGAWTNYSNNTGLTNPTTNTYTVTGLTNGQTYNFSVAARDNTGVNTGSDYSASVTGTPSAPVAVKLSTPTNLTATPSDGKVTLNWSAVPNANNYTVRWGQNGAWTNYSNNTGLTNPTTNTYTVTGLTNGQTYNFSVAARDSTGVYPGSDYSTVTNGIPNAKKLGDTDNNGTVDIIDLSNLLSKWGQNYPAYDYSTNNKVDIVDLSILLNNWTI